MGFEPTEDDAATMAWLLNGRRPKYRRANRRTLRTEPTVLDNADACDSEFQRLLWYQTHMSLEQLRLEEFNWVTAGVSYDDAAGWFSQGASYADKALLFRLAAAGITAKDTAEWWSYSERGPNLTIMTALRTGQASIWAVKQLKTEQAG